MTGRSVKHELLGASAGLILLVAIDSGVAALSILVSPAFGPFWPTAGIAYAFTVPLACYVWLTERRSLPQASRADWKVWLSLFPAGIVVSMVSGMIDLAVGHPGPSAVFTIGAVAFTLICVPSAARSWLIEALRDQAADVSQQRL